MDVPDIEIVHSMPGDGPSIVYRTGGDGRATIGQKAVAGPHVLCVDPTGSDDPERVFRCGGEVRVSVANKVNVDQVLGPLTNDNVEDRLCGTFAGGRVDCDHVITDSDIRYSFIGAVGHQDRRVSCEGVATACGSSCC